MLSADPVPATSRRLRPSGASAIGFVALNGGERPLRDELFSVSPARAPRTRRWPAGTSSPRRRRASVKELHPIARLRDNEAMLRTPTRCSPRRSAGTTDHPCRRVVHRQLPRSSRSRSGRRGGTCRAATAASCRGSPTRRAAGTPARLRHRARADLARRRSRRRRGAERVRRGLPDGAAAAARRAVGDPDHAAAGADREPAPRGRLASPPGGASASAPAYWVAAHARASRPASPPSVVLVLAEHGRGGPAAHERVRRRAREPPAGPGPVAACSPMSWLEQRLAERGETVEHVFELASQSQAADQVSISNSIGSLRFLGATDWRDFVEAHERGRARRCAPTRPASTRPWTSRRATATATWSRRIARALRALRGRGRARRGRLGRDAGRSSRDAGHVGYFLVDDGRGALERPARARASLALRGGGLAAAARLAPTPARHRADRESRRYCVAARAGRAGRARASSWPVAGALLAVVRQPARARGRQLGGDAARCARCCCRGSTSRAGIPPSTAPGRGADPARPTPPRSTRCVEALEVRFLANRDPQPRLRAADRLPRRRAASTSTATTALLQRARDGIEALNAQVRRGARRRPSSCFHRARRWNPREGCGWAGSASAASSRTSTRAPRRRRAASPTIVGDARARCTRRPLRHHARHRHRAAARRGAAARGARWRIR